MTRPVILHTLSAVAAVALLFAFAASNPSAAQTSTTGSIEGTVTDSTAAAPTQKSKGLAGSASQTRKKTSAGFLWSSFHNND